jgi:hypothetical protein
MPVKERDVAGGQETAETRVLFRVVSVFDRTQVAPVDGADPAPLEPLRQPLSGDTHAHLIAPASAFARSLGYAVSFEETPAGVGGWCDRKSKRIVVDAKAPANARLRTLIHEKVFGNGGFAGVM